LPVKEHAKSEKKKREYNKIRVQYGLKFYDLASLCHQLKKDYKIVYRRYIQKDWPLEDALNMPMYKRKVRKSYVKKEVKEEPAVIEKPLLAAVPAKDEKKLEKSILSMGKPGLSESLKEPVTQTRKEICTNCGNIFLIDFEHRHREGYVISAELFNKIKSGASSYQSLFAEMERTAGQVVLCPKCFVYTSASPPPGAWDEALKKRGNDFENKW